MGGASSVVVDDDLAPICAKLNLTTKDAAQLHKKFQDIDRNGSGVIDIDEFFGYLGIEKTPFGAKMFELIDENGSGHIDFNEFLVGLWNMCTFDEESLIKFAFQLIDKDDSGYVDSNEICEMVKSVHGKKFARSLIPHVRKVMKKYDANNDDQYSFNEFKGCHKDLPLLFMPAFTLKNLCEDEFFGDGFWKQAKRARKKDIKAQNIRDFLKLNAQCQRVGHPKYSGGGGGKGPPGGGGGGNKTAPVWEASNLDDRRMKVEEFDPGKVVYTRADQLEARHAKEDKTGFRRFDLDPDEAARDYKATPIARVDVHRCHTKDISKNSKSQQSKGKKKMSPAESRLSRGVKR